MANSNEEQKNTPAIKKNPDKEANTMLKGENNSPAPPNRSFITLAALIIALGALGTAAYTLHLNNQVHHALQNKNSGLSTQVEQLAQHQAKIQALVEEKSHSTQEMHDRFQAKFNELNQQVQSAMSQRLFQDHDWLLYKARYYLELAEINVHWSDNLSTSVALLQQADELLQQLKEPQIFDIRQALAKDIAQLQAISPIDSAGILSQLDAAEISISDLNLLSSINENKPATENTAAQTSTTSPWRMHLQNSINLLGNLVVIRRHDEHIKPLMSPLFEALLKESINLNLQEAQWAVLNNNPSVYQLVLKQALIKVKKNFNARAQNTTAVIKKLNELQQISLTQEKPALASALPLLNQLIASKQTPDNSGGTK